MKCPFCAEEIQEEAKKCRHCGEWLNPPSKLGSTLAGVGGKKPFSEMLPAWLQGTILFGLIIFAMTHPILVLLPIGWTILMRGPWGLLWVGFLLWAMLYRSTALELQARGAPGAVFWFDLAYKMCIIVVCGGVFWHQLNGWKSAGRKIQRGEPYDLRQEILARLKTRPELALLPAILTIFIAVTFAKSVVSLVNPGQSISALMPDIRSNPNAYSNKEVYFRRAVVVAAQLRYDRYVVTLVDEDKARVLPQTNSQSDVLYVDFVAGGAKILSEPLHKGDKVEITGRFEVGGEYRFVVSKCRVNGNMASVMERPEWISPFLWQASSERGRY